MKWYSLKLKTERNCFDGSTIEHISTDAFGIGLGAVLSQEDSLGQERPVEFCSQGLNIKLKGLLRHRIRMSGDGSCC